jgi:hypothetical protein
MSHATVSSIFAIGAFDDIAGMRLSIKDRERFARLRRGLRECVLACMSHGDHPLTRMAERGARKRKARRAHASGWWWTLCSFSYVARVLISQLRAAPLSRSAFTAAVAAGSAWSGLRAGSHAEVIAPRSGRR